MSEHSAGMRSEGNLNHRGQDNEAEAEADHQDQQHEEDDRLTGSLVRAESIADLDDQEMVGINTPSNDLKKLLEPGTIVHFWASWCAPCKEEFPELERFYRTHISGDLAKRGIRLIAISNDRTADAAARFMERQGTSFPTYLDTEQITNAAIVGEYTLPSTVMIDGAGRFHRLALGKLDWGYPNLPDLLAATADKGPAGAAALQSSVAEE